MLPILNEMLNTNQVRVLYAIGAINMMAPLQTIESIQNEFDQFVHNMVALNGHYSLSFEFIDLPFFPCVTQLKDETHGILIERTDDILAFNKLIKDTNMLSVSQTEAPQLSHCGIDNTSDDIRENRHILENWREKPSKNSLHLCDKIKSEKWMEIIQYFKDFQA